MHYTHSVEDKQSQPGTEGIENSQIRLTDGSVIFTPDLFGPGITVNQVDYRMMSIDAGVKYQGHVGRGRVLPPLAERTSSASTPAGIPDITDNGYQMQTSAMAVPKVLQLYLSGSQIFGNYGDPSEVRVGSNWYFLKRARPARQRRVHPRQQEPGRLHGVSRCRLARTATSSTSISR